MKNNTRIVLLLSTTLLIMSLVPLGAALIFFKEAFVSQERIYKSQDLNRILATTQEDLRVLSKLKPENKESYKNLFEEIQDLKLIYSDDPFFSEKLSKTLTKYFFTGFGAALALSLVLGLYVSSLISRMYKKANDELLEQRDQAKYLEEVARWQEVAKRLAHEIRRPLQPIGTWMSNLRSSYSAQNGNEFGLLLEEAKSAIDEEIRALRRMVDEFARFADLPKPDKQLVNVCDFLNKFVEQYACIWDNVTFSVSCGSPDLFCPMDPLLLRQVLTNMIENAVEANPGQAIAVTLSASTEGDQVTFDIFNSGLSLAQDQREKIFDLYYSTKSNSKNRGLGLSIVKLAVLEHNGNISCLDEDHGVRFRIKLPTASLGV